MSARESLIAATIDLVRRHGVAATGLAELIERSGRSRRTIYLNFPEGKAELVAAAVSAAGAAAAQMIRSFAEKPTVGAAFAAFADTWTQVLTDSGFTAGCPIVAATLGRSDAPEAADAAGEAFRDWETILATRLQEDGVAQEAAQSLATTIIAATEGAVIMSLAARSTAPLERTSQQIATLIEHQLRAGAPAV
ncbi:TetR/AcrR family transcriptional regulator [Hoyosella subflava]|uniref:Transcriptional regulatory protein n=1 Tax=Hoyosella subflava (strain DSM 45089 / JCM 17490 / NBRC 109087 / DQS3-9A1) TaxID=443218 RepID=F6ENP2_HOYSD|nr:TetR family transcriptional regulator [Hoyosella subflava]AEF42899.1 Transcriptional regulatory protein [Hoyosella subflava DQS3-9A1]